MLRLHLPAQRNGTSAGGSFGSSGSRTSTSTSTSRVLVGWSSVWWGRGGEGATGRVKTRVVSRAGAWVGHLHEDVLLRALEDVPDDDEHHEDEQAEVESGALELIALARREGHWRSGNDDRLD